MKKLGHGALVVIAFLIGCATASVAPKVVDSFIVPPIQADTIPQKWEHLCFLEMGGLKTSVALEKIQEKINEAGKQGFELVNFDVEGQANVSVCLKRPIL
jgi:hypothetical protein